MLVEEEYYGIEARLLGSDINKRANKWKLESATK